MRDREEDGGGSRFSSLDLRRGSVKENLARDHD